MAVTRRWQLVAWTVILVASELLYADLLRFQARLDIARLLGETFLLFALYGAASTLAREGGRWLLWIVLAGAVLFRLTVIPVGLPPEASASRRLSMIGDDLTGGKQHFRPNLLLDDDVWRYLWDGHITARTGNPYSAPPAATGLDRFAPAQSNWPEIRRRINHPDLPTIYPPAAQVVFLLSHGLAPGSVVALKLVFLMLDLAGIALLMACLRRMGRPASAVILYAWNPLVILMLVAGAHADGIAVTCLTLTFLLLLAERRSLAGLTLGLSVLTKLSPIVLLPLLLRRLGRWGAVALLATLSVGSLPLLVSGGGGLHTLGQFATRWDFNSAAFQVTRAALMPFVTDPGRVARIILGLCVAGTALAIAARPDRGVVALAKRAAATLGVLLVLSPTVMPWYATWPLALSVIAGEGLLWIVFSALVCLSFPMTSDWQTHPGWLWLEFGSFALLAVWSGWFSLSRGRSGSGDRPDRSRAERT